MSLIQY